MHRAEVHKHLIPVVPCGVGQGPKSRERRQSRGRGEQEEPAEENRQKRVRDGRARGRVADSGGIPFGAGPLGGRREGQRTERLEKLGKKSRGELMKPRGGGEWRGDRGGRACAKKEERR